MKKLVYLLLASSLLIACGDDSAPTTDKGAEENPLTDGKTDSFFRPTEHGPASFARANNATIAEDQTFHAWNFELSAESTVELRVATSTRNLDTVMYLYRRQNEDESWGRYIEKNDDHDGNLWSQIDGELEEGLYRVIVKPFKSSMTGTFALRATCEGEGCPVVGDGTCAPDSYESLPSETGFGAGCSEAILEVVTSELEFENQLDIPVDQKCGLNPLAAIAVDYYVSYWDDVYGFEDLFGTGDPDEAIHLNVEEYTHERGTVIWIDAYADEDGMRLVFDNDDELLALYQSNQSPDNRFYCGDERDFTAVAPSCWSAAIDTLRWNADNQMGESGSLTVDEAGVSDEIDGDLVSTIYHFSEAEDLAGADEIAYERLIIGDYGFGSEITLSTDSTSATYWVADAELIAVADADGTRYLCEFIDL